jgi:hypothetical protein
MKYPRISWEIGLGFLRPPYKVHRYLEYHSVGPLIRMGTPPSIPSPASECVPLGIKRGEHSPAGEGGGPKSDDWRTA